MDSKFDSVRFKLFTQSYCGHFLSDYLKSSSKNITEISNVAKALLFKKFRLKRFVFDSKYRQPIFRLNVEYKRVTGQKISIYLQIEHELWILQNMKRDREKFTEFEYQNSTMLLELAIERVAGNNLKNVKSDGVFDEELSNLIKIYRRWYYTVAYTYKLPTIRILPFIMRLIS